ncbi:MAG: spermidine/putrescine ABC transporter ATP-binding protein PotA [Gammaproteobacteria bacterium]|nr:spermidine/putrescine ABC transporter ATP-binding protein PotA [Gammaproteobacteria bacterium]
MSNIIEIKGVSKHFGDDQALHNINLNIKNGEFLTLLGPSGCGKTTLLRILSGFETANSGTILLSGKDVTDIPPEERHVNLVFQNYALFPHMTVFENVAFGLRCKHTPLIEINERVNNMLNMVKLNKFAIRKPHQLSGGQQQRVAIARAVINEPIVLLLDEPLSALDYHLRRNMQIELKDLQRRLGITFVFVTHDQEEALSMSDRVAVMHAGCIDQLGTPRDVYEEPCNVRVAKFIGQANIFDTKIVHTTQKTIQVEIEGEIFTLKNSDEFAVDENVHIVIRPEDIEVWGKTEIKDTTGMLPGIVEQVIYKGSTVDLIVRLHSGRSVSATQFFNEDDENLEYDLHEKVWVKWMPGWEVTLRHMDTE